MNMVDVIAMGRETYLVFLTGKNAHNLMSDDLGGKQRKHFQRLSHPRPPTNRIDTNQLPPSRGVNAAAAAATGMKGAAAREHVRSNQIPTPVFIPIVPSQPMKRKSCSLLPVVSVLPCNDGGPCCSAVGY